MNVFIDNGSTSSKSAYFDENGDLVLTRTHNRCEFGIGYGEDDQDTFTTENGSQFTFFHTAKTNPTNNIQYQTSDHCLAAIHYALHDLNLDVKEVNLYTTLPVSLFFNNGRKDQVQIEEVKTKFMQKVKREDGSSVVIKSVNVLPEAIPAAQQFVLNQVEEDELTLVADVGGTTLDLCLFEGEATKIVKAGTEKIGMFDAFSNVRTSVGNKNLSDSVVFKLIETGEARNGKITVDREEVTKEVISKAVVAIKSFLGDREKEVSNIIVLGGSCELLHNALKEEDFNVVMSKSKEFALVESIAELVGA
ncbi:plasmid segregation protein ParM [Vibrio sp.]|nr:plasmid segregation protein ParM [Vibrio sp.]